MLETHDAGWPRIITFYRELIEIEHCDQQPMLEFVTQFAQTQYAKALFPSTSLNALCLSNADRQKSPFVALEFLPGDFNQYSIDGPFRITYFRAGGHPVSKNKVKSLWQPKVLQKILGWLGVSTSDANRGD